MQITKNEQEQITAAIEILYRILEQQSPLVCINTNADLFTFLKLQFGMLKHEEFSCLFLNSRCQLLAYEVLFKGSLNYCTVYPREVVKRALALDAAAIILAHNHPGMNGIPSQSDIELTNSLRETLARVDVRLHDHIIIYGTSVYSMRANGQLS